MQLFPSCQDVNLVDTETLLGQQQGRERFWLNHPCISYDLISFFKLFLPFLCEIEFSSSLHKETELKEIPGKAGDKHTLTKTAVVCVRTAVAVTLTNGHCYRIIQWYVARETRLQLSLAHGGNWTRDKSAHWLNADEESLIMLFNSTVKHDSSDTYLDRWLHSLHQCLIVIDLKDDKWDPAVS